MRPDSNSTRLDISVDMYYVSHKLLEVRSGIRAIQVGINALLTGVGPGLSGLILHSGSLVPAAAPLPSEWISHEFTPIISCALCAVLKM